jgi:thioredoxin
VNRDGRRREMIREIGDGAELKRELGEAGKAVVVDIWAPWCGPCRATAPDVDALAAEYDGRVETFKVNTDSAPDAARQLGVRVIPTFIALSDGREIARALGARSRAGLRDLYESALAGRSVVRTRMSPQDRWFRLGAAVVLGIIGSRWDEPAILAAAALAAVAGAYDLFLPSRPSRDTRGDAP